MSSLQTVEAAGGLQKRWYLVYRLEK